MLQLFVSVNGSLAHSSAHLQKSTNLMNQMIVFLMTAPITTKQGVSTTFHQHFVKSDESQRLNSDQCEDQSQQSPTSSPSRSSKQFWWPVFIENNRAEAHLFLKTADAYLQLCAESVRPIKSCSRRGRRNCYFFFKGIFGSPHQMGKILGKTFEGE
jgi:hypothetical protein